MLTSLFVAHSWPFRSDLLHHGQPSPRLCRASQAISTRMVATGVGV